jgi:hypothetical protein
MKDRVELGLKTRKDVMQKLTPFLMCFILICTKLFAQDFTKITEGPMVNDDRYSEGSAWGDINNDNFLDLFVPHAYNDKSNLLFLNNGDGSFTQVTDGPVVTNINASSGGSFGDFDNDGHLDLFVQNWNGINSRLYMNNGDGTFTRIASGDIVNDGGWSFNSSIVDYDNDGNLDIHVTNGTFTSFVENNFFYKGNGDGTFTKITSGSIVDEAGHSLSSSWCDYDDDGDQDLFVANSDPFNGVAINNFFYQNNGDGTFTKLTEGVIVNDSSISTGGSWGDYDNDGDFDLFVANWYGENNALYQNNGDGTFSQITSGNIVNDGGNSVSGAWGDYDNDGNLDLYVTNDWNENNFLYSNNGNGTFTRITTGDIVNDGGRSNGATWADYDNDGYLDLFVPNGQRPSQSNFLYRNNGLSNNNWINIKCVGTISNTSAIGTKVKAKAIINGQIVWQLREVSGHQGFNAQESFNVEFGFGDASVADSLILEWSSGLVDVYTEVEVNKFYCATEGEGLDVIFTFIEDGKESNLPNSFELSQNYPNPFTNRTSIQYAVAGRETKDKNLTTNYCLQTTLKIFDLSGRLVRTLVNETLKPGHYKVDWDGRDDSGNSISAGIYFYHLQTKDYSETRKMILIK